MLSKTSLFLTRFGRLVLVVYLLSVAACRHDGAPSNTTTTRAAAGAPTGAGSHVGSPCDSTAEPVARARAWFRDVVATANASEEGVAWGADGQCGQVLAEQDVLLFISAGYAILPELIGHVHNTRHTRLGFYYPWSSALPGKRLMVGEVACYMIEAMLRETPYFTMTARLRNAALSGLDELEQDRYALDQAADAYEQWYHECFDEVSCVVICPPERLPAVNWDYAPKPWLEVGAGQLRRPSDSDPPGSGQP